MSRYWRLELLLLEGRFYLWKEELKNKLIRRKHCHKGFHKLIHGEQSYLMTGKKTVRVHYIRCQHCKYIFFARESDKKKYLRMKDKERSVFFGLFSGAADEQLSRAGDLKKKNCSSSSSEKKK